MTILGKFVQQPQEIEFYSIQFIRDMAATDEIESTWSVINYRTHPLSTEEVPVNYVTLTKVAPYTAVLTDDLKIIRSTADITLPESAPDGYTQFVSNYSTTTAIVAGGFTIPIRAAAIIKRVAGTWEIESSIQTIMVNAPGDQRVRIGVAYGVDGQTYKTETTAILSEGRQLQDELVIRFKEN